MHRQRLIPIVVTAALSWAGCSLVKTRTAQQDAKVVFLALRANEQNYQSALRDEVETLRETRLWLDSFNRSTREDEIARTGSRIASVKVRLTRLHDKLNALPLDPRVKGELLTPILQQLKREEMDLDEVRDLLGRSFRRFREMPEGATPDEVKVVKAVIERHEQATNLFTPALRHIRENYRFAKQGKWHGLPLTA